MGGCFQSAGTNVPPFFLMAMHRSALWMGHRGLDKTPRGDDGHSTPECCGAAEMDGVTRNRATETGCGKIVRGFVISTNRLPHYLYSHRWSTFRHICIVAP